MTTNLPRTAERQAKVYGSARSAVPVSTLGFALCALVLSSGGASAQAGLIDSVWQKFGEYCGAIIQSGSVDPAAYVSLPPEHRIAQSTDGNRIQIDHQTQDQKWSLSITQTDLGDRRYLHCHVGYHNLQPLESFEAIASDLRARLELSGATALAGGEDRDIKITSIYAAPGSGVDKMINIDALGLLSYPEMVAQFHVYSYGIGIGAFGIVSRSEQAAQARTNDSAETMRAVIDICMRNYRTPQQSLSALESAGMALAPTGDQGGWEFSGGGVFGNVTVNDTIYCSIQSQSVPLDTAQAIGTELAYALFPNLVQPGAPEGGRGPCDGLSIFAPRQMLWLRYAQAGNSGECINDGTSAVILN